MSVKVDEYTTKKERNAAVDEEKRRLLSVTRVRQILYTEGFVEVVNLLLDISNFNGNNYTSDTDLLVYMEGRRSVFHDFLGFLEECDMTLYPTILLNRAKEIQDGRGNDYSTDDTDDADDTYDY